MNPWRGLSGLPKASYLIACATFINRAGVMVRPFLVVYLVRSLGFSESFASWMLSLYGATGIFGAIASGWLTDRFGPALVLRGGLMAAAAAMSAYPFARGHAAVIACTFLFALFNELPRPALMTLVAEVAPPELRKRAFVLSRIAVNLGLAVGPALGGHIAEWSYVAIFWVDAGASLLAALLLARTELPRPAPRARVDGSAIGVLARDRLLQLFFVATMLNAVMFFQHDATMVYWMTTVLGLRARDYGLTVTVNTLLIVLVEVELNTRLAHWSHRRSLVVGSLVSAAGFAATALADGFWSISAAVVVWTFGEMIAMPAMSAFVADIAPRERRGLYMSTLMLAFGAGLTIGPKLGITLLLDQGAATVWLAAGGSGVAAALLYAGLGRKRRVPAAAPEEPLPEPEPVAGSVE